MKMKDFFKKDLVLFGDTIEDEEFAYAITTCEYKVNGIDAGEAICYAVNNHDKLVNSFDEVDLNSKDWKKVLTSFDNANKFGCDLEDCIHDALYTYLKHKKEELLGGSVSHE